MKVSGSRSRSDTNRSGDSLASWEGMIEVLLAKVKNASGRIGIF